jgi:hypothetical protein
MNWVESNTGNGGNVRGFVLGFADLSARRRKLGFASYDKPPDIRPVTEPLRNWSVDKPIVSAGYLKTRLADLVLGDRSSDSSIAEP